MNFLAHLHIAQHCQSSLLGNLLGDFVKGNPQGKFPQAVVEGIQLHRFVDSFTDHHPTLVNIKPLFDGQSRRFCAIALDMFWDHCLARRWDEFDCAPLADFCHSAERQVKAEMTTLDEQTIPQRFISVSGHMWQGKWLESYAELDNIEFALMRMSTRSARMANLTSCFPVLEAHYDHLLDVFDDLYSSVLAAAKRQAIC